MRSLSKEIYIFFYSLSPIEDWILSCIYIFLFKSNFREITGGPSSSCEMIILQNLRPLFGIEKYSHILNKIASPYFRSTSLVIWPLTMLKRTILRGLLHEKASLSSLLSAELNFITSAPLAWFSLIHRGWTETKKNWKILSLADSNILCAPCGSIRH